MSFYIYNIDNYIHTLRQSYKGACVQHGTTLRLQKVHVCNTCTNTGHNSCEIYINSPVYVFSTGEERFQKEAHAKRLEMPWTDASIWLVTFCLCDCLVFRGTDTQLWCWINFEANIFSSLALGLTCYSADAVPSIGGSMNAGHWASIMWSLLPGQSGFRKKWRIKACLSHAHMNLFLRDGLRAS